MKPTGNHRPRFVNRGALTNLNLSSRNESVFSGIEDAKLQHAPSNEKVYRAKERRNLAESVDFAKTAHYGSPFTKV